jgi:branched-chain amino acid transport system substrate-binding protein
VTQGIPTVGDAIDGPEWGSASNPNLFGDWGSFATNYPTFTTVGKYFKKYGTTKLGVVGIAASPSAIGTSKAIVASAKLQGISTPVADYTATFGDTNFTADALAMKNAGVDAVATEMVTSSNIALIQALKQDGVKLKAEFISGGYQQALLSDPASLSAALGISFQSQWAPADLNNAATKAFASDLAKYAGYTEPNPQEGQVFGYFPALLMIKGIQVAGKNPTWGSFSTNLRKVTNYDANGLINPVNFTKFGNVDSNSAGNCWYQSTVKGTAFVPLSVKPFCGTEIAGSSNS